MEAQICHLPACGGVFRKETMASAHLTIWEKAVPQLLPWCQKLQVLLCMPLVPFKLASQCWSSEEVSLSKSVCGFFKRNFLGLQKFLLPTQSLLDFAARSYGDLSSWHWNPGLRGLVWGWDSSLLLSLLNFYPPQLDVGPGFSASPPFHPIRMDVFFFNSIVVRFPFNLISNGSEWWLLCVLVVILMWFCEEASMISYVPSWLEVQISLNFLNSFLLCILFLIILIVMPSSSLIFSSIIPN